MKFVKLTIIVFFAFISFYATAQDGAADFYSGHLHRAGIISPNATSIGALTNTPINTFTGVPEINIPLYELKIGTYTLPIALIYNASGIKVGDIPSWVGSGWSLDAGGVITRTVVDVPDDYKVNNSSSYSVAQSWLYNDYINSTLGDINNPSLLTLTTMRVNMIDCEPDIYNYRFPNHSGKFIFNNIPNQNSVTTPYLKHTILPIPNVDLLFDYLLDQSTSWVSVGAFTINDEEGNQYTFDKGEYIEQWITGGHDWYLSAGGTPNNNNPYATVSTNDMYTQSSSPPGIVDQYKSAWYLSKITTVQGRNIYITYANELYQSDNNETYSEAGFPNQGIDISKGHDEDGSINSTVSAISNNIHALRLASIYSDDFLVTFNPSDNERPDLVGAHSLKSIQVYAKPFVPGNSNQLIKEFDFTYNTLVSPPCKYSVAGYQATQRIQLASVIERGADGSVKPPYLFSYDNSHTLSARNSAEQDIWGYYNGNGSTSMLPALYIYPSQFGSNRFSIYPISAFGNNYIIFSGADRTPNSSFITTGMLNQITYPTGGYQQFKFEANTYNYLGQNFTGGGVRLQQSTLFDGISHNNDVIRQYTYNQSSDPTKSSGVLFNLPVYAYTNQFPDYWSGDYPYLTVVPDKATWSYFKYNLIVSGMGTTTLSEYDGINVGYSEIEEHILGRGYVLKKYSTPAPYGALNDASGSCNSSTSGYCDGLFSTIAPKALGHTTTFSNGSGGYSCTQYVDYNGLDLDAYSFPFAPRINYDWNRGHLLTEKIFDENNTLVNETDNTYINYTPNNHGPLTTLGLKQATVLNNGQYSSGSPSGACVPIGMWQITLYSVYPVITNIAKLLSSSTTKIFDRNNTGNFVATTTNYTYALNEMQPSKIETIASNGDIVDKHISYPSDYVFSSTPSNTIAQGIKNEQDNHIVSAPVEMYVQKSSSTGTNIGVTHGLVSAYNTGLPVLPVAEYKFETSSPLTSFTPATLISGAVNIDPHYNLLTTVDCISNGNIIQETERGNRISTTLWGYNKTLPVADVTNAQYNLVHQLVAYTSFEESDPSAYNWTFGTSIITGSLAKTGNNYYNLLNGSVQTNLPFFSGTYILSFWGSDVNAAHYTINAGSGAIVTFVKQSTPAVAGSMSYFEFKVTISASNTVTVSTGAGAANNYIDELRLYPNNALMKTYTYKPLVGITSVCDEKSSITTYEYDDLNRLVIVRDNDGNIIKKYEYGIQAQD